MFKTVSLPADLWAKITRRLTVEVGADDESRRWADAITEQTNGAVKVRAMLPRLHYLRLTKDGHPGHPLYLPASLRPVEWVTPNVGAERPPAR